MARSAALLAVVLGASSGAGWDGPLYPVQNGRIILPLECSRDQLMSWDDIASHVDGLHAGGAVTVLTESGAYETALGEISCFIGECQGNYVAIALGEPEADAGEPFAAAMPSFLDGVRLSIPSIEGVDVAECSDLYSMISVEAFPEISDDRTCESLALDDGSRLELATKWFMQENGWPIAESWVRVRRPDGLPAGAPFQLDYDTNPLGPMLVLLGPRDGERILWSKRSGICCPSRMTLTVSQVDDSGELVLGRNFTAGGQPCD